MSARPGLPLIAAWLLASCALPAFAQTAAPGTAAAKSFDPRDLNGVWEGVARLDQVRAPGAPPPKPVVSEPPLKPQFLAPYRAKLKADAEASARGEPPITDGTKCIPGGMPAIMQGGFPMEVLQTPGQVTIIQEAFSQVRRIYLDEAQIAWDDAEPLFWGHSAGRWDGDVLKVNTIGIKEHVLFHQAPHSDRMTIDEEIRLTGPETLEDRITVTDPAFLTEPWTFTFAYVRKPGYKINEYVCEDNRYQATETGGYRLKLEN